MSTGPISATQVSVEDYLDGEIRSAVKHDYLGGILYAQLRGKRCQSFGSDMKFRINDLNSDTYFYYPDAMIACDPTDTGHCWRERPTVVFEIISEETRLVDEREKRMAYKHISALQSYVRIEQSRAEIAIDRRTAIGWISETLTGRDAILRLPEVEIEIPLAELYERIVF